MPRLLPRCLLAVLGGTLAAQDVAAPERYREVRARIAAIVERGETPALSVAVLEDDAVVWAEGFGLADRERQRAATADTVYRLASISKPLSATALMTLVERGALDLDRPVNDYLGDHPVVAFRGDAADVTLRRLCNHTAGLPTHWRFCYAPASPPPRPVSIRGYGLCVHPPGAKVNYSNLAFGIVDHVVAQAAGEPFAAYLQRAVLDPLDMTHTGLAVPAVARAHAAVGYVREDRELVPVSPYGFDHDGASAVWSSARDLMRFARLFVHEGQVDGVRVLRPETARAMQTPRARAAGSAFGIGWSVGHTRGHHTIGHTGGMPGVSTALRVFPRARRAVAVLTNHDDRAPTRAAMRAIVPVLLADAGDDPPPDPGEDAGPAPAPAAAAPAPGRYRGFATHPAGPIPLALEIGADGATLTVAGEQRRLQLLDESPLFVAGPFAARTRAVWPDGYGEPAAAELQLALGVDAGDPGLRGLLRATHPRTSCLPHWVELQPVAERPEAALRVISYNVLVGWRDHDVGRFLPGALRRARAAAWLAAQQPDVVALQELNGFTEGSLRTLAGAWGHPHVAMLKQDGYPVALTSRTPITVHARLRDGLHHGMLHATTAGVDFVVVHLPPQPGVERKQQELRRALQCCEQAAAAGRPAVVLGDCNAVSSRDVERFGAAALQRYRRWGYRLTDGVPSETAVDVLVEAGLVDLTAGMLPDELPLPRIDFVFATRQLAAGSLGARWLCDDALLRYSDHPPVVADLSWHGPR